jgi:hypothetical protein
MEGAVGVAASWVFVTDTSTGLVHPASPSP